MVSPCRQGQVHHSFPFVLSLSKDGWKGAQAGIPRAPFDRLRANGVKPTGRYGFSANGAVVSGRGCGFKSNGFVVSGQEGGSPVRPVPSHSVPFRSFHSLPFVLSLSKDGRKGAAGWHPASALRQAQGERDYDFRANGGVGKLGQRSRARRRLRVKAPRRSCSHRVSSWSDWRGRRSKVSMVLAPGASRAMRVRRR